MTNETEAPSRGVKPQQIAMALQDLGYRGYVDKDWPCVQSAAMGLEFRVTFYSPYEDEADPAFASYMFDMGLYASEPVPLSTILKHCNELNREYRFVRFFGGQNSEDRCYIAVQMDVVAEATDEGTLQQYCAKFVSVAATLGDAVRAVERENQSDACDRHRKAVSLIRGSDEDQKHACELYWWASRQGFAGSQNNLGDLYERGHYMPSSQVVAAYWYARAAERGEPTAYLSLANLLTSVAEDNWTYIEAAKFAILAVERLHEGSNKASAREALDRLATILPEDAMDLAKADADRWEPLFQETRLMLDPPEDATRTATRLN